MTRYSDFENNKEVTDVLFCIISGHKAVKEMIRILKQPQSTISTKLQFLVQNKIIIKEKWSFEPNWNRIYQIMYKILKENSPVALQLYMKSLLKTDIDKVKELKNVIRNIKVYFPESRLKRILEVYSKLYFKGYPKTSITDVINQYLVGLMESAKIKDKNLLRLKEIISSVKSKEAKFFQFIEKEIEK